MKKTFKLWAELFSSPSKGFSTVKSDTPIALTLIIVLVLILLASSLLIPILNSDAYTGAISRAQVNMLKERGTEMSAEQIEAMQQQLQSSSIKTITVISSTAGGVITYLIITVISVLILKLLLLIFKEKQAFKLLFKIIIFIALISAVQMLLKNLITVITDYERVLSRVQYMSDLQYALSSPISLAAIFSPAQLGNFMYFLIDAVTDIFNWLYYGFLFAGLRYSCNISKKKALAVTIIFAILMTSVGLVMLSIAG